MRLTAFIVPFIMFFLLGVVGSIALANVADKNKNR